MSVTNQVAITPPPSHPYSLPTPKRLAQRALLDPRAPGEEFGPLSHTNLPQVIHGIPNEGSCSNSDLLSVKISSSGKNSSDLVTVQILCNGDHTTSFPLPQASISLGQSFLNSINDPEFIQLSQKDVENPTEILEERLKTTANANRKIELKLQLACILISKNLPTEAKGILTDIGTPKEVEFLYRCMSALSSYWASDFEQVEQKFKEIIDWKDVPSNLSLLQTATYVKLILAEVLCKQEKFEEAEEIVTKNLVNSPLEDFEKAWAQVILAEAYLMQGKISSSSALLTEALASNLLLPPQKTDALLSMVVILTQQERWSEVEECCKQILKDTPLEGMKPWNDSEFTAINALFMALIYQGHFEQCISLVHTISARPCLSEDPQKHLEYKSLIQDHINAISIELNQMEMDQIKSLSQSLLKLNTSEHVQIQVLTTLSRAFMAHSMLKKSVQSLQQTKDLIAQLQIPTGIRNLISERLDSLSLDSLAHKIDEDGGELDEEQDEEEEQISKKATHILSQLQAAAFPTLLLAEALFNENKFEEAEKMAAHVLEICSSGSLEEAWAQVILADIYKLQDDFSSSERLLTAALDSNLLFPSKKTQALLSKSIILASREKWSEVERCCKQILVDSPLDGTKPLSDLEFMTIDYLLQALTFQEQFEECIRLANTFLIHPQLNEDPQKNLEYNTILKNQRNLAHLGLGKTREAASLSRFLLKLDTSEEVKVRVIFTLSMALAASSEFEEAFKWIREASGFSTLSPQAAAALERAESELISLSEEESRQHVEELAGMYHSQMQEFEQTGLPE